MTNKSCFVRSGLQFHPSNTASLDVHMELPVGNYIIQQDPRTEALFFEQVDSFEVTGKMYGDTIRRADRIIHVFQDRPFSTGIALTGEKGSGKTLLTKLLCMKLARDHNVPTIIINQPWVGDAFNKLIQSVQQPCVILFDEFEKVYIKDHSKNLQEKVLTLLDGVFPSKKLFLFTVNDKSKLDGHLNNRPGRIYYMIEYNSLSSELIVEYCNDNLKTKKHIPELITLSQLFTQFNFDMLKAIVEEMNRFNESPAQVMELLNARPQNEEGVKYKLHVVNAEGEVVKAHPTELTANPIGTEVIHITDYEDFDEYFYFDDLINYDLKEGLFKYKNKNGISLTATRAQKKDFNFHSILTR